MRRLTPFQPWWAITGSLIAILLAMPPGVSAADPPLVAGPGGADRGDGTYLNPILGGNWPDPSIARDGKDYYLVHSANRNSPSLLVWHSQDLVNWRPLASALPQVDCDVWAPDIARVGDTWHIYYCASNGSNYVVSARNPAGPWSKPIDLKVGKQIDPGHLLGEDGQRYLFFNRGMVGELTPDGLSMAGALRQVMQPWPIPADWQIEGAYPEGPKLFRRGGWYYALLAQGGTAGPATSHMVTVQRARSPLGPWECAPVNPLIRTASAAETWWSVGHGTLIDAPDGSWWLVYHGYRKDFATLGRSTLLLPVEWTDDGWPRIPAGVEADQPIRKPAGAVVAGGLIYSDAFTAPALGPQWRMVGHDDLAVRARTGDGMLRLTASGTRIGDATPVFIHPAHAAYRIEAEVSAPAGVEAGLTLYYNGAFNAALSLRNGQLRLTHRGHTVWEAPAPAERLRLRITNDRHVVGYEFAVPGQPWQRVPHWHEMSGFHHNTLGGFLSLRAGLFAAGQGEATFREFIYTPLAR